MPLCGKRAATIFEFAPEWLLASVDSGMGLQITVFGESFVADLTLEWLFSCVSSLMDFEPP